MSIPLVWSALLLISITGLGGFLLLFCMKHIEPFAFLLWLALWILLSGACLVFFAYSIFIRTH